MRIIAGEFRGRSLLGPVGKTTRPITDRVKQSLFDILTPRLADSVVLDLFAGTGSMGLECLSRGARSAHFFEADRPALDRLRQNLQALGLAERGEVIAGDLFKWFASGRPLRPALAADLVFLDPPYPFLRECSADLCRLAGNLVKGYLAPGGMVIFRHDAGDDLDLFPLSAVERRDYGKMAVEFLQAAGV